ncbi:MAG: Crp/Fnr family transcriptional regulator [Endomicrobiia bacterium]|nr:Crp/Fnr family transcriptional regulator [Endomicrobiia bacterium]
MSVKDILKKIVLFRRLSERDLDKIKSIGKFRNYKPGEIIFGENTSGNALYIVLSGVVKIFTQTGLKKKTLAYLQAGEFFGEMSLIDLKPRSASAVALENCELMVIEKKEFNRLLSRDVNIVLNIMRTLTLRLRTADQEIERLAFSSLTGRLAKTLVDLVTKHSKPCHGGYRILIRLSHQDLADFTGTSREMISKQLNNFKRLGYIKTEKKALIVLGIKELKKLCPER